MKKTKLVILQTHPIQYFVPLFRVLSQNCKLSVTVLYLTDSGAKPYYDSKFGKVIEDDLSLLDGYNSITLKPSVDISTLSMWRRNDLKLTKYLREEAPDWLWLHGYSSVMNWIALTWGIRNNKRILYTSDSNAYIRKPLTRVIAKYIPIRFFFSQVSAFLSPSASNKRYLLAHGADPYKIYWYPYAISFDHFSRFRDRPKAYDFVWAGKLTIRKRPLDFIRALIVLVERGFTGIKASLVGDGELMNTVHAEGRELIRAGILRCTGFVNYSEMSSELSQANIFVFTSENEPYGLVATEAAATGAALIVAEGIGCVGPDSSAQPGVNTVTYPKGNVEKLADMMELLLNNKAQRSQMQQQSIIIAQKHDVVSAASVISSVLSSL